MADEKSGKVIRLKKFDEDESNWHEWSVKTLSWKFLTASIIIAMTRYNYYKLPVCIFSAYAWYVCIYTIHYTLYRVLTTGNEDFGIPVKINCRLGVHIQYNEDNSIPVQGYLLVSKQF